MKTCHDCRHCDSRFEGIFARLGPEALETLDQARVSHDYARGQSLFFEGGACTGVYCIRSGLAKVSKAAPRDRQHVLYLAGPGSVVGLEAKEGDLVSISPCRPLSRRKSYSLVKVLERAGA
jgi:CRP-like cAMP-binding protein